MLALLVPGVGMGGGEAVTTVEGPFRIRAGQVFTGSAKAGQSFSGGARQGQTFTGSAVAGQVVE